MTIQELIDWFSGNEYGVLGYFLCILLLTLLITVIANQSNFRKLRYVMSGLVFAVTIPGILAVLLILYSILFLGASLLNVSIIAYFLPVITMILTLIILSRKVSMKDIPGFDKLSALMIIIGITFIIIFILQKSFFGVFFVGGFVQLLIAFLIVLLILKLSWSKLRKQK
nr:hypothetical protein [uncultured Allomuricauda sp.]